LRAGLRRAAQKGCFYYDGFITRDSSSSDIDHLVPLSLTWDFWTRSTAATPQRYANDLGNRSRDDASANPRLDLCDAPPMAVAVVARRPAPGKRREVGSAWSIAPALATLNHDWQ
jgi:hypothetical protein